VRLLKRQSWLKARLPPAAVNLFAKMNGHMTFRRQPKNTDGLKKVLQLIWGQLPQDSTNKAILHKKTSSFCERWDGHLKRALSKLFNDVER